MESQSNKVIELQHPLIQHKLSILRDKKTGHRVFRETLHEITLLMAYELTKDLPLIEKEIETPLTKTLTKVLANDKITVVPVLRAGMGMVEGLLKVMPDAKIGHVGVKRDHDTLLPKPYYLNLPDDAKDGLTIILDPMLGTGGTLAYTLDVLKENGISENVKILNLVCSETGLKKLFEKYPNVPVYTCSVDPELNEIGYIVPGLGDAGDRIFGTM